MCVFLTDLPQVECSLSGFFGGQGSGGRRAFRGYYFNSCESRGIEPLTIIESLSDVQRGNGLTSFVEPFLGRRRQFHSKTVAIRSSRFSARVEADEGATERTPLAPSAIDKTVAERVQISPTEIAFVFAIKNTSEFIALFTLTRPLTGCLRKKNCLSHRHVSGSIAT